MSLILYKAIAGILIFATSLIAVAYPIQLRAHPGHHPFLEIADAFASGVFLGTALFHLLPDAIKEFAVIQYPLAELFCAAGFLIFLFLERLAQLNYFIFKISYIVAIILIIHSFIEGVALGTNTTFATAFIIFIAIIAHKSSESFALAVILNRSHSSLKHIILIIGTFSIMTPLGIILGSILANMLYAETGRYLAAGFNAFAAGTFLYMSTLHHINHHHRVQDIESLSEFWFLLTGLTMMAALAWWV